MRWHSILALPLLTCLLVGCIRSVRDTSVVSVESGPLVVEIWASTNCAEWGKPVSLRASVTNEGSRTFIVELKDQPALDIVVGNPDSSQIRWSAGKPLTPDLTRLELKPGQSKTIEMQWVATTSSAVSARFIYSPERTNLPIRPSIVIYTIPNCPGGI